MLVAVANGHGKGDKYMERPQGPTPSPSSDEPKSIGPSGLNQWWGLLPGPLAPATTSDGPLGHQNVMAKGVMS